jgi:TatA/E family protein of Tat protein translocase
MAFDDPIVWILIAAVVIFLFGAGQIPKFARSIGLARREFNNAFSGIGSSTNATVTPVSSASTSANSSSIDQSDPLVAAAQREGIDTRSKTKEQIASELSFKLNKA